VVLRPLNRLTPQELRNDLRTALRPARRRVTAREYPELEEMFGRDFEDVEYDAREYPEINDLFERADAEEGKSRASTLPQARFNSPFRFGLGTVPRPNRGQNGPVVHHSDDPETIQKLHDIFNHHRFGGRRVSAREYHESEEMFGRDFEDVEFDAREYPEINDLFERADAEGGKSRASTPFHWHSDDPETFQKLRDHLNRPRFGRPRDTVPRPNGGQIGHGPVVHWHWHSDDPETFQKLRDHLNRPRFGRPRVSAREYPESEEMFRRDFEDVELDARDYDDLYLD